MGLFDASKRKNIFEDTLNQCDSDEALISSINHSIENQFIVLEGGMIKDNADGHRFEQPANVLVTLNRTLQAAKNYPGKKAAVLNFANAFNAGGGVRKGSSAQEESLCRCSTLYECISDDNAAANFHEKHSWLRKKGLFDDKGSDDCIYTPDVTVFKTDTDFPQNLSREEWYQVDVITCAAPDLNDAEEAIDDAALEAIHIRRAERILEIAKRQGVDIVVLGAFGCGAFKNDPYVVARAFKTAVGKYLYDFETIEFAVYGKDETDKNYYAFQTTLKEAYRNE